MSRVGDLFNFSNTHFHQSSPFTLFLLYLCNNTTLRGQETPNIGSPERDWIFNNCFKSLLFWEGGSLQHLISLKAQEHNSIHNYNHLNSSQRDNSAIIRFEHIYPKINNSKFEVCFPIVNIISCIISTSYQIKKKIKQHWH